MPPFEPTDRAGPMIIVHPDTGEGLDQITPPLGTMAVAGVLEREGIGFAHIDQRVEPDAEKIVGDLVRGGALCLGVSCQTGPQISRAVDLIRSVKEEYPRFPVIMAGWHASILPDQTLAHPAVDIVVRGQGELTALEIVGRLRNGQGLNGVLGAGWREGGRRFLNGERPMVELDDLPYMAYHLVDLKKYPGPAHRRFSPRDRYATFRSSQGCPWRCDYCADPLVFKRRWKKLSAGRTVDELQVLVEKYGVDYVDFVDDTFIVDVERTEAIARELIKRRLPLKWSANARTGMIARLPQRVLDLLAEAGLDLIHPGVEAADQEMLDRIHKDERNENTLAAAEKLSRAGIAGLYSFMIGFPEEPASMAESTLRMAKNLKEINHDNIIPVNFYVPYPGSVLFEDSKSRGFKPPESLAEWARFGTRAGLATPWLTREFKERIMRMDKFYLPAAFPSRFLLYKMKYGRLRHLYRLLHRIAKFRVDREWYRFDWDWKLLLAYWRFWGKWHRRIPLPNLIFR